MAINNWNKLLSHLSFQLILHNVLADQISHWTQNGCIYFYASQWCQKKELAIKQLLPHHVIKHIQNSRTKIFQILDLSLISARVQHHGQNNMIM